MILQRTSNENLVWGEVGMLAVDFRAVSALGCRIARGVP